MLSTHLRLTHGTDAHARTRAGNEGYGLRTNCARACTEMIQIGHGAFSGAAATGGLVGAVDSLNVSVATGIILHQLIASSKVPAS